jgi:hypothetical protein
MMSRKDYRRAAQEVIEARMHQGIKEYAYLIEDIFVRFFRGDNPEFDETKFREACRKG